MATNKPDDPEDQDYEPGPSSSKIQKLEHQNKVDHKKQIHYKLIAELTKFIFVGESGYERLLIRLEGYGLTPIDKVDCRKSASNLFDWMKRKGIIKVGKYDDLLEVLDEENEDASDIIRQYQAKMEEISRKEEGSRQKPDDQPRSRRSKIEKATHKKQATLSQELKVIEKRTLKRLERQLSSNTFVQTQAVTKGKELIDENKILIYTGIPGEGKTENALCVLNLLRQESPNDIYLKLDALSEWKYVDPDLNLIILLDDCFGKTNANSTVINDNEKWREIEACIKEGMVRLIVTIRKHIFVNNCTKLENNGTELFMKKNVIDLSTDDFCLTKENKKEILDKYCQSRNIEICQSYKEENITLADQIDFYLKICHDELDAIVQTDCPIGFPYTCFLFFSHSKYTKQGVKFFNKPLENLKININDLASSNSEYLEKTQYILMCYMMLKGGKINLKNLDQDMLDNIMRSLRIGSSSEREKKEAIENLNHRYVVGEYPIFVFKHQTILECVALCFADDNIKLLLQLCSEDFISEFIRPTDYKKRDGEEIIRLDQNDYKYVIKRLIKDLQENYGYRSKWWSTHPLLGDEQFVDLLIDKIKSHELCNNVRRLYDEQNRFIYACKFDYTYFIDKLYNELHVDLSNVDTGSALIEASKGGLTETVMWLLNLNIKTDRVAGAMAVAPTDTLSSIISHQNVTLNDVKLALTYNYPCISIGKHCDNRTVDVLLNRWPDVDLKFLLELFNACIDYDNDKATSLITLITRISDEIQHCINKVCYKGSLKVLKSVINEMPHIKTKQVLNKGFTLACAGGHLEIVDYLLGLNDNDIDKKSIYLSDNDMNITNLHVAAYFGSFEILMKLIAIGVDVNCKSKTKKSVLSYAIEGYGTKSELVTTNNEIINLLYCSLNRKNVSFIDDMRCNTNSDYIKVFDYLLILDGINLNDLDIVLDEHGHTFAHYCALNNEKKTINLLLNKYKTVIFSKTKEGLTSLHIAAFMGYFDVFEVLVEAGLRINDRDKSHRSVLRYAIMGHKYYYSRHKKNKESDSLFFYFKNFEEIILFPANKHQSSYCLEDDRLQILTYILQSSNVSLEELDILDDFGMSLVHYCTLFDDEKAIELLHSCYKQSVFSRTKKGLTCLHIAAFYDYGKAFKALVKVGLSIKDRDMSDRSVLQYAVMSYIYYFYFALTKEKNCYHHIDGETDIESSSLPFELNEIRSFVVFLLTKLKPPSILLDILSRSDVSLEELDVLDNRGIALVHYCVLLHDVNIINLLVENITKSISCKTKDGLTCLHIAAFMGYFDIFKVLVEAGLNIKDKDKSDRSVLQYAFMGYKYYYTNDKEDIEISSLPFKLDDISYNIEHFLLEGEEGNILLILNHILQSSDVSLEELGILDNRGMALVHYCVLFNDVVTINLLVSSYKKYVYYRTKKGLTCLHIAAFTGNSDVFEVLVKAGLSIKDRDNTGTSVLPYVIMGYKYSKFLIIGHIDSVSLLGDLESILERTNFFLTINNAENYLQILTYILQSSDVSLEELDILDDTGMALVHYCTMYGDVQSIQILIERCKKSVFCRTKEGSTCLHIAAFLGNLHLFEVLVKAGFSTKELDHSSRSVLQYATMGSCFYEKSDFEQSDETFILLYSLEGNAVPSWRRKNQRRDFEKIIKACTH